MSTTPTRIDTTDVAKLLRQALKAAHPGVKFSVRSHRYAGGSSIDVSWTDGPTEDEVRATTELYTGASFDGMTDSKSYHDSVIVDEDGQAREVHFGADFIFTHRQCSPEFLKAVASMIRAQDRRGTDRFGGQCRACMDRQPPDYLWWVVRERFGSTAFVCSPECGARIEVRYGHVRPGRALR